MQFHVLSVRALCAAIVVAVNAFAAAFVGPDLAITTATLSATSVVAMQPIQFGFTVQNTSGVSVNDAVVTVTLPEGIRMQGAGTSGSGAETSSTGRQQFYAISLLESGEQINAQLTMLAPPTSGTADILVELDAPTDALSNNNTTSLTFEVLDPPASNLPDVSVAWSPDAKQQPAYKAKVTKNGTAYQFKGTALVTNKGLEPTPTTGTLEFWLTHGSTVSFDSLLLSRAPLKTIKAGKIKKVKLKGFAYTLPSGYNVLAISTDPDRAPFDNRALFAPLP